ncbi:UDP-N-acetylmuramoyl-tripeptide--D-alanyl-D-alanine ligase [secondary endosymbiont of Heteropsylla cubana]|uniref:UDP-N-acetylmuramoyl-tripeptide--D-alanyl-D-alanine ligase n=1 Tax=secondary endosymbiont of Heteropsylla cubana TaxID=134287 RepID=J3Z5R1_9ENTR|nr:UDP-N-acetylmuramoyl-tripeptide--D-alanyl-D-alanine ligase [secondary endosymbiont of Heteropsylla cubana]AFP85694.1 UDP-N-acetylmuramoyl-tripeptide--D-alanyl-D-alanine ligase [secondary endosymbiont of Heteropsylla cubana]
MIPFTLKTIARFLHAEWLGNDCTIDTISTDSRVLAGKQSLFVALRGKQFDGHDFAKKSNSTALLVNRPLPINVPQLIVADTHSALGQLGVWVRQQITTRVVALTGSSGKTLVKEMTSAILQECGQVLKTDGNCNNQIGVPLTLLQLTPSHDFAVIELGANQPTEIAWMIKLIQPETTLINNVSPAHLDGFKSLSGVAQAKSEIFTGLPINGCAILNADSNDWLRWKELLKEKAVWRFSVHKSVGVDFFASNVEHKRDSLCFTITTPRGKCSVRLALLGEHNIANALAACALAISVGADLPAVSSGLGKIRPLSGRINPILLRKNQLLLDDTYNANVSSMNAAIQVLNTMTGYRVMVVGDMAELGEQAIKWHQLIGENIRKTNIDKVLSVGRLSYFISQTSRRGEHFQDKDQIVTRLTQLLSAKKTITILIKGSRSAGMEKVVQILEEITRC